MENLLVSGPAFGVIFVPIVQMRKKDRSEEGKWFGKAGWDNGTDVFEGTQTSRRIHSLPFASSVTMSKFSTSVALLSWWISVEEEMRKGM